MKWEYLHAVCVFQDSTLYAIRFNSGEPITHWERVSEKSRRKKDQLPIVSDPRNTSTPMLIDELSNNLGKLEWELVTIGGTGPLVAVFKRSKVI